MELSIVVPVYNVEKYITKCISSLLHQDFDDYEIIIVDDGSKDNSIPLIQQNFSDTKIRTIHQENQGLSAARNTGLKAARGEYAWFFDSDDWLSENVLTDIISSLKGCEALYFTHSYEEHEEGENIEKVETKSRCKTGCELSLQNYPHCVQFYIYKRKFLLQNNLLFEKGIFHEDSLFTPCTLYQMSNIVPYDIPVYHRLIREGSITHIVNPKRCYDLCFIIDKLVDFSSERVSANDRNSWNNCVAECCNELLYLTKLSGNNNLAHDIKRYVNERVDIIPCLIHAKKQNTRIWGIISKITRGRVFQSYNILYYIRYFFRLQSIKHLRILFAL